MTIENYRIEKELIAKKAPTISVQWQERPLIEQLISPLLPKEECDRIFHRLVEVFKPKIERFYNLQAEKKLKELIKQVSSELTKDQYRIAISMKLFRELYAEEIGGWGGTGRGLKTTNNQSEVTLRTGMRR